MDTPSRRIGSIPPPHRRYFDEYPDEKRQVTATVKFFPGTGSHFQVEIIEEPNYVFDPSTNEWVRPLGDRQEPIRHRFMKFNREETARRWIRQVFAQEFSEETHRLELRGDVSSRWFYPEGD